jgi:lipopolysaccharide assembly outer membrane protein LptD (OstA)
MFNYSSPRVSGFGLTVLLLLINVLFIKAQQVAQIEILNANSVEYDKNSGINARKLIGNVQFKHENAIMSCDSAYFYSDKNFIDAFGHIYIHQGDTLHLYGDLLKYDGNSRVAKVRKNVKLIDRESVLTTEYLDFEIAKDYGYYINGGKIVNGNNNLRSNVGYYYAKEKLFYYRGDVVIINPDYTIKSDTLKYNTVTKTAFFFGPTNITSKENYIYCENGWYNTETNISQFNKNAFLRSDKQKLLGDSLYYERNNGIGRAFKHIWIIDTTQQVLITGNYAQYREKPEYAMITDSAVFMQYSGKDTLYVHADTLLSIGDSAKKEKTIRAFNHVKLFRWDMQGKCDSLTYTTSDSTVRLFYNPVLWSDENQMTSDYIELHLANKKLNTVNFYNTAFVISKEDSVKYSQIKGRKMTGYFKENELYKVVVSGNGQTVYYAKDKDEYIGVNKAESSDLVIYLENRKIKKIVFLTQPSAILYPLEKAPINELILRDFKWYSHSRPLNRFEIFKWYDE